MLMGVGQRESVCTTYTPLYLLGKHPALGQRLDDEVSRALGARRPTAGDLPALPLARNAVLEAMRLYPPAWALFRVLETGRSASSSSSTASRSSVWSRRSRWRPGRRLGSGCVDAAASPVSTIVSRLPQ